MKASGRLAVLSAVVAIGALAAYVLLLRVAVVRNHPEGYVVAFALATALAARAVVRARARRWPAWLALGLSSLLLVGGAWFNFVLARVPDTPTALRVGERPPEFTLPDAAGRPVALADYRGQKPVVLVFYRLVPPWAADPPIWELRVGAHRVFYDVAPEEGVVYVRAIRLKRAGKRTEDIL